jgi:ketosteroid isomerase-like protein
MIATVEETDMSGSAAIAVVRRFYDSKGDPVRFIHLWTVRDGKLARLQQAADSLVIDRALNG